MKIISKACLFLIIICSSLSFKTNRFTEKNTEIHWLSWDAMQTAQKEKPKKVFVDIYTNWCGWCKKMDATTFHNQAIVAYINTHYYAVKFDAEMRETVVFKNQKFRYLKNGSRAYNELATTLLEGNMSFPTTVFLDEKLDVLTNVGGFLEPKELDPIISFFATDNHLKKKWSQYERTYKSIL